MTTHTGDVPTVALTGVTAGLGRATVAALAHQGANLVLLARDPDKAAAVADQARASGSARVEVIACDLSLMASVRAAVAELAERGIAIDTLVNDAAVATPTRAMTSEGNELMLATNYLGPCLLTRLILADLPNGRPFRLIGVGGPLKAAPDLADLDSTAAFAVGQAFERSKTALNLFIAAVPRHVPRFDLRAVIYSPGLMKTGLSATLAASMNPVVRALAGRALPDPATRADGLAALVLATDLAGVDPGSLVDSHGKVTPMPLRDDIDLQDALWEVTSQRLGLGDGSRPTA